MTVRRNMASVQQVNRKDKDGRTPLMLASIDGHKNIIEHLIANNVRNVAWIVEFMCSDAPYI